MFKKALLLTMAAALLTLTTAAAWAAPGSDTSQTMQLSSWQSEGTNGVIAGGMQTVTITNTADTVARSVTFHLAPPPCDCALAHASATSGAVRSGIWILDDLPVGGTATLDLVYVANK
jgi:hypothetical protein